MPLYKALVEEGSVSDRAKARIAEDITLIHTTVMKVPREFVRVIFMSYPKGGGYAAGEQASTAALDCTLRSGHTTEERIELLKQLWAMLRKHTGVSDDLLAISLTEIPASDAMEMGRIMMPVIAE
jgi:phenylpyruvate tautomerase PptA (4-oxalocrotonate tautomerase family)